MADRRAEATRTQLAVAGDVVAALEVDGALPQQRADDREGLLEPRHAMVEGEPEGAVLDLVPARAQAEHEPPAADLVDGRGELREDGRLVEAGRRDERARS